MLKDLTLWVLLVSALVLVYSCAGERDRVFGNKQSPPRLTSLSLLKPEGAKQVTGPPTGVIVVWQRVNDPRAVGYYVYRDTKPILSADPSLRANGGQMVPQPDEGETVTFYDRFYPTIGVEYFYRISVVDIFNEESDLSNQMSIIIQAQVVTDFSPKEGYYGDFVNIAGENFGIYNALTDSVQFPTDSDEWLSAEIETWDQTLLTVRVPEGAITGRIRVVILGTVAETEQDFVILNPYLTAIEPSYGFIGDEVAIRGANLGDAPGESDGVLFPGNVFVPSGEVLSWSASEVRVIVPPQTMDEGLVKLKVGGATTNGVFFSLRPKIIGLSPLPVVPGSNNIYALSGLNFGTGVTPASKLLVKDQSGLLQPLEISGTNLRVWSGSRIEFYVPEAVAQYPEPAFVVRRGRFESNEVSFTPVPKLSISFSAPPQFSLLRSPTVFTLSGTTMVDRVEYFFSYYAPFEVQENQPFYSIQIDPARMVNGRYTLFARAYRLSEVSVTSITFDVLSLVGDVNGDGVVDDLDTVLLPSFIGLRSGGSRYRAYRDPNLDGMIDERDASLIGYNYLQSIFD